MTRPSVSVVIASRHRPDDLRLCLKSLDFQTLPEFEVVVVGAAETTEAIEALSLTRRIKHVGFDEPNLSRARNLGVEEAAGDIVAFLDDDAVPEPTWLTHLSKPFDDSDVDAAGGFVLGRNGISYQWKAEEVASDGTSSPIKISATTIFEGSSERAIKTQGTNCAYRRATFVRYGGFDEAFQYYLEDTDLNLRMAGGRRKTALVPEALVHHKYSASVYRRTDRAPRDLLQLGASYGYFVTSRGLPQLCLSKAREEQRRRLLKFMVSGELEPDSVIKLLAGFDRGFALGMKREPRRHVFHRQPGPFRYFKRKAPPSSQVIFGHQSACAAMFEEAEELSKADIITTVFSFSRTALFHHCWFHEGGFWVQTGGLYGKSLRSDPYFRHFTLKMRAERERQLLAAQRLCIVPIGVNN